jgi:hypothetical protein
MHMNVQAPRQRQRRPNLVPLYQRGGWRPEEFAALVGISPAKVWRSIKAGTIPTVEQDGIRIIPRSYAVAKGYLTE